ncbi:MAG: uracil phosphoribosyltransferase [Armatimonadetes bacterium]|nr:uracil phosphoribosyltransferase [Armatimonadota bacterium]MDE2207377.1 uracil phosphoribosyltransferase [Armatimonadota bacterium]
MPLVQHHHPLVHVLVTRLRSRDTDPDEFRRCARAVTALLIAESASALSTSTRQVQTPLEPTDGVTLKAGVVLVPVLRAGLGMLEAALELLPGAAVGFIGLERDEATARCSEYYRKLPPVDGNDVMVLDPMLATGGSACAALAAVDGSGCKSRSLICIVAAPEGIDRVSREHPDVSIIAAAVDRGLDCRKYILPGLGDFGDRLYGT